MGVRGLETFILRKKLCKPINIENEVTKWKSENPGKTPIVVIDFQSLAFCKRGSSPIYNSICGGGHLSKFNYWMFLLEALKDTGCKIVFFDDLIIQETKIDEWLRRRNDGPTLIKDFYDLMTNDNPSFMEKFCSSNSSSTLSSTLWILRHGAKMLGDFHCSVRRESDVEMAQYANRHNALAIITCDTDLMIFDGAYKYWSAEELRVMVSRENEEDTKVWTLEYDRDGLRNCLSLSQHHLPLLATLLTNDFTHGYFDQLIKFYKSLELYKFRKSCRVENVARYVLKVGSTELSDLDIRRLTQHAFGKADAKIQRLISQSLNSYDIDFSEPIIGDPLEEKLLDKYIYRYYMYHMGPVQDLLLEFYDMRDCLPGANITLLHIDWLKRKTGIVKQRFKDDTLTFKVLAKRNADEEYVVHIEKPIYPDFEVPSLDRMYLRSEAGDDSEIIEFRWKVLGFIMTLPKNLVDEIRRLPTKYILTCTVLLALVKERLLDVKEADGILYTEYTVEKTYWQGEQEDELEIKCPTVIVPRYVRAAHLYIMAIGQVRGNFAIAGLLRCIDPRIQFEGVFYQELMQKNFEINDAEDEFAPIKAYRIYAIDNLD